MIAALDGAVLGPTYRAGVLRGQVLAHMDAMEEEHGVESVAYEMHGPPRRSKLLFEASLLRRLYGDLEAASKLDADRTAEQARLLVEEDDDLRQRILSVGLPILLPDGEGELTYCPKNYYNVYYGITTLRRALELSYNATAVKLQQLVGSDQVVETARRFGISTELHPYPSLALGSLGVRLIDLTT